MKRKVRITETQLNDIIKKALKEQQEDQVMATGPDAGAMSGGPEAGGEEGGEPDFTAFMSAAQELMGQGITIGGLVDKICEAKDSEGEVAPEGEPEPEMNPDEAVPSDNQ